jgi:hypothetical protein
VEHRLSPWFLTGSEEKFRPSKWSIPASPPVCLLPFYHWWAQGNLSSFFVIYKIDSSRICQLFLEESIL